MALVQNSELRSVYGITDRERDLIRAFLQGAIYSWIISRPNTNFAARDIVGGKNNDWTATPLSVLYEKHINDGKSSEDAQKAAGIDLGWLLKTVIAEDNRLFEAGRSDRVACYRWVENAA